MFDDFVLLSFFFILKLVKLKLCFIIDQKYIFLSLEKKGSPKVDKKKKEKIIVKVDNCREFFFFLGHWIEQ